MTHDSDTRGWKRITHQHYQKTIDGVLYEAVRLNGWPWTVYANKVPFDKTSHCIPDAKRAAHKHAKEKSNG